MKVKLKTLVFEFFILTVTTYASVIKTRQIQESSGICETPGCLKAASILQANMDPTINPCNDFYKFACGGYINKRTIPDDKQEIGVFMDIYYEHQDKIKELVEKPLTDSEPKSSKLVKEMYQSCINLDNIETAKDEPLKKVLNALGGWPVVEGENWDEASFNWMETVFKIKNLGYSRNTLVTVGVSVDSKNNTAHIIKLDQASLGGPSQKILMKGLSEKSTEAYLNLMVKAAKKLGANEQSSRTELTNALNFEIALATNSLSSEERRKADALYNKISVKALKDLAPQVDWLSLITSLTDNSISDEEIIIVAAPNFMKKFAELIEKTDKRTIANYMMWRVVQSSLPLLSKDWKNLEQEYKTEISGETPEMNWYLSECMLFVTLKLPLALSAHYIRNNFGTDSKDKALEIVKYLRQEFLVMIDENEWMNEDTKAEAKAKENAITQYIGYPEELLDDSKVMKHYENLKITSESYFTNMLNYNKWVVAVSNAKLRKPNTKGEWQDHALAAMVNAYYNPKDNTMDFPAAVWQKEFFTNDRPYYMNFGSIGTIIGHEITHGFDSVGVQYDKDGNERNWWDETADKQFKDRVQCIIEQYGNYTAENGMKINGVRTAAENTADNGGMKNAYRAYRTWVKDHGPEPKLPGLNYTPGQLFWISAATTYCAKYKPEAVRVTLLSDTHSLDPFRVIGPMSNFVEFSKEWECPLGSPMNPEHKCKVW